MTRAKRRAECPLYSSIPVHSGDLHHHQKMLLSPRLPTARARSLRSRLGLQDQNKRSQGRPPFWLDYVNNRKPGQTTKVSNSGLQNRARKRMLKLRDYDRGEIFKVSAEIMANKIKHIFIVGLIIATGAILGVAATAILIVGIAIEYKIYSKPGWPFGNTAQK